MKGLTHRIIRIAAILLLLFVSTIAGKLQAQPPQGYYSTATGLSGSALKSALHDIIDDHTEFPYTASSTDTWDILKVSDRDPANPINVILVYLGTSVNGPQEYNNGNGWTREHVWPQSLLGFTISSPGVATDVHNLKPADDGVNSSRSNKEYDNGGAPVNGVPDTYSDSDSWEPRDSVKGDVARIIFYMAVRYEGDVPGEPDLEMDSFTNGGVFTFGNMGTLLQWHANDPVSAFEQSRNNAIYSYQQNRNPFIDHPEWVDSIWGNTATPTTAVVGFSAGVSSAPEPNTGNSQHTLSVTLSNYQGTPVTVSIADAGTGTASPGVDYTFATQQLTFSGNGTQTITITLTGDGLQEGNETVNLALTITGGTGTTSFAGHVLTILDYQQPNAWINEIHYDNTGTDSDELVEIVIEDVANYTLSQFTLTLYNGNGGGVYDAVPVSQCTAGDSYGTFSLYTCHFPTNGIQNGSPDGLSLDYGGTVIQFLSYEGTLQATAGPAIGLTSVDIGVSESDLTPVGHSLQLTRSPAGMGIAYGGFTWGGPMPATAGSQNTAQVLPEHYGTGGVWHPSAPTQASGTADVFVAQATNTLSGDATIGHLEVAVDASLTLSGNHTLQLNGHYTNNGTVTITDGSSVLMADTSIITGNITVERIGTPYDNVYQLWSSPVEAPLFADVWPVGIYNHSDLYQLDATGTWVNPSFSATSGVLESGRGYAMTGIINGGSNTVVFTGTPHNGTITQPIAAGQYQCVGNPYPSAIGAVDFIMDNAPQITGTLWFWDKPFSGNNDSADYAARNLSGGIRGSRYGNRMPGDYIGSTQGFLVQATGSATQVTFANAQRVAGYNQSFFKGQSATERLWLSATYQPGGIWNHLLIAFDDAATDSVDWGWDGAKVKGNTALSFFSRLNGEPYCIQALSLLYGQEKRVPLGLEVATAGDYTIAIDSIDGLDPQVTVYLHDKARGIYHDLRQGGYTLQVSSAPAVIDQLEVVFNGQVTGVAEEAGKADIQVILQGDFLQLSGMFYAGNDAVVQLFDLTGRVVAQTAWTTEDVVLSIPHLPMGWYLLRVSGGVEMVQKIWIR